MDFPEVNDSSESNILGIELDNNLNPLFPLENPLEARQFYSTTLDFTESELNIIGAETENVGLFSIDEELDNLIAIDRDLDPFTGQTNIFFAEDTLVNSPANALSNRFITEGEKIAIQTGLNNFISWLDNLERSKELINLLPTNIQDSILAVDRGFTAAIDLSNAIQTGLVDDLNTLLNSAKLPTTDELLNVLKNLSVTIDDLRITVDPTLVTGGSIANGLQFNLKLDAEVAQSSTFNLQSESEIVKPELEAISSETARVKLETNSDTTVDITGEFSLDFGFGVENKTNNSSEFYLKFNDLLATGEAKTDNLNAGVNLGFLEAEVAEGTINLDATAKIQIVDPNNDNKITIVELQNTSIEDLVEFDSKGKLDVKLPIDIGADSLKAIVSIHDDNIFAAPAPTFDYDNEILEKFLNFQPEQIQSLIEVIGNSIQEVAESFNPDNGIPYLRESIDEIVNFSEILTNFGKSIIETGIVGTTDILTGKISQDAVFYLRLNNEPDNVVGVRVIRDDTNENIDDLVADINTAFVRAKLNDFVRASYRDDHLILTTINPNDRFTIVNPNSIAINEIGLVNGIEAVAQLFPFTTLWNLANIDLEKKTIDLDLTLNKTFQKDINLDFQSEVNTDIGAFTFIGDAAGNINVTADLKLGLTIDLNEIGSAFILNNDTLLSSLNGGRGIYNQDNTNLEDIKITLRDGTIAGVDFGDDNTVGNAINSLVNHPQLVNKIQVEIIQDDPDEVRNADRSLKITDLTQGEEVFTITAIDDRLEGLGLGILGIDSSGTIKGSAIGNDLSNSTPLDSLNNNAGVRFIQDRPELQINLRDGSSFQVNFVLTPQTTLNDIIATIKTVSNNRVNVSLTTKLDPVSNQNVGILQLEDLTTGNNIFKIGSFANTSLGEDLGILGTSNNGIIAGTPIASYAAADFNQINLNFSTPLSSLNTGKGVRDIEDREDILFSLRNGETIYVDLVITEITTVGDIINAINTKSNGKVIATFNEEQTGLKLTDNTSGINSFSVTAIDRSLVGLDLGILGVSSDGTINGKAINRVFNGETQLSELNDGDGVRNGEADIKITLRDGTNFIVNLDRETTIQDVITTIENASKGTEENAQPRVKVNINGDLKGLSIIDRTLGNGIFTIEPINNSFAASDLGIIGVDIDGIIEGRSVHGDDLFQHIFITRDSGIAVTGEVTANDVDLSATFGLFKAGIRDGIAKFDFTATGNLNDPNPNDLGISLQEITDSLTTILPIPNYTATGNINLPIELQGLDLFDLETPTADLKIAFEAVSNPEPDITTKVEFNASLPDVNDIEAKLKELAAFSTDDLLILVDRAIVFFQNDNLGLFNQKVPLLNKSLNELLDFVQPIVNAYNDVKNNLENLKSELSSRLEKLEDLILDPSLIAKLPTTLSEKLQNAFTTLDTAIQKLPTGIEIVSQGIPSELILAVTQFQDIISSLPSATIEVIKTELDKVIDRLPIPDKTEIDRAKNKLYNVISNSEINLELFRQAFDEFRIEIAQLLDPEIAKAIIAFQVIVTDLETVSVQEIATAIDKLDSVLDLLPDSPVKTNLIAARDKIQQAINNVDYLLLDVGIEELKQGIINLTNLGLPELEVIFSQLTGFLVKDLFDRLIAKIPAIDTIEDFIADAIGIEGVGVSLSLNSQNFLLVNLDWEKNNTQQVPLDFSLDTPFRNFVSLDANINVNTKADIDLDFVIDLSTTPDIYLLPSTQLNLSAFFDARVSGEAGINNLVRAKIENGSISLQDPSNPDKSANFSLLLQDNNNDGKIILTSSSPDAIAVDNSLGTIQGNLPVAITILGEERSIGNIAIAQTTWTEPVTIDTSNLDLDKLNLANFDVSLLQIGVDRFLGFLQQGLESDILAAIPLVGDKISGKASNFIEEIRQKINEAIGEGLTIDPDTGDAIFPLMLTGSSTLSTNFDLGLDALNLVDINAEGGVEVGLDYDINLEIGVNKTGGFFFKLSPDRSELNFGLTIKLEDNTTISSKLFFLEVAATNLDEAKDNKDYNKDGDKTDTTGFRGNLGIDIIDPTPNDNKLTLNDLSQVKFSGKLSGNGSDKFELNVLLQLDAGLGDESLPSITTNLGVTWRLDELNLEKFDIANFSAQSLSAKDIGLTVGLYDISLDVGDFITKVLGSTLKTVDTYIEPLRPIFDFLTQEVPIISSVYQLVGLGKFTVLDAIGLYGEGGPEAKKVLQVLITIGDIIEQIKNFDDSGNLQFVYGDYIFDQDQSLNQSLQLTEDNFKSFFENFAVEPNNANAAENNIILQQATAIGIEFPIFKDIGNIVQLLLGGDPDIITWQIPELKAGFKYNQIIGPIFPPFPIFLTISAGLKFFADLSVGFDTRGLRTGNFLDGFYFGDRENISQGKDTLELSLIAFIAAGVQLNIAVASIGVEGGLQANIFADWNDPNQDGKLYYDELLQNARRSWMCIFDFKGELAAFLDAYVTIGYDPFIIYQNRFSLLYLPLFSFTTACETDIPTSPSGQAETNSTLGHYSTGFGEDAGIEEGTLILHVGRFARLRQPGVSVDTDEQVYITRLKSGALEVHSPFQSDYRQQSVDPYPTGSVQVFGDNPDEAKVTKIYIDSGIGNDLIEIDELVTAEATILGGDGDDTILVRTGTDPTTGKAFSHYIEGGAGNDRLISSIGDDIIIGGVSVEPTGSDGNDTIVGGGGNDIAIGDNGRIIRNAAKQIITVESIAPSNGGNDTILVSGGNDIAIGGVGNDNISGDRDNAGEDVIFGDNGRVDLVDNTIVAITSTEAAYRGDDRIYAGLDDDFVIAGGGEDYLEGSTGEDILVGDDGKIAIQEDLVTEVVTNADSGAGRDLILGGAGSDIIFGGGKGDRIVGNSAIDNDPDLVLGDFGVFQPELLTATPSTNNDSSGDDIITTGDGNDIILAGAGNDTVTAYDGINYIIGDNGIIQRPNGIVTRLETISPEATGNDIITTGKDDDYILAGTGNDTVTAYDGINYIIGDNGIIQRPDGIVTRLETTSPEATGNDIITTGNDDDLILAGAGNDTVTAYDGINYIIGDNGIIQRPDGIVTRLETTSPEATGNDIITTGNDDDLILAGAGNDTVTAYDGINYIIGDNGIIQRPDGIVTRLETTSPEATGNDIITTGNDDDYILAGTGDDLVTSNSSTDFILGDNGIILLAEDKVTRMSSNSPEYGGNDLITTGNDDDTAIGGTGNDRITGGNDAGKDILIGDNGTFLGNDGTSQANDIFTKNPTLGGVDIISGGAGDDIIIGGTGDRDNLNLGGDALSGNDGNDLIIGDNAYITRNSINLIEQIKTTIANLGGNDAIGGGKGEDIIIGGFGRDTAQGNENNDLILGDNAFFDYNRDGNLTTLDFVTIINPTLGSGDTLSGNDGNDLMLGGTLGDSILAGTGNDLVFGDHAKIEGKIDLNALPLGLLNPPFKFTAIATLNNNLGGDDNLRGEAGDDIIFGQQGNDKIYGEDGNDDLIGGHNISQGDDGNDSIDGGNGSDVIAGDNAAINRQPNNLSPRYRVLIGTIVYNSNGKPQVNNLPQANPTGKPERQIKLLDGNSFGNDYLAGGVDNDLIFGQQGNDIIQGDSSIAREVSLTKPSVEAITDGDDYIEGNSGDDLIFGNLGQDDIIGGSSNLFGYNKPSQRLDGQDTIFGGAGTDIQYNDLGDNSANGHARDADVILGDHGNIFRLVGTNGTANGQFLTFNYDNYSTSLKIIPRAVQLLDDTLGGDDILHGESGDDILYGMTGNDIIFGEGQDDDIIGGMGSDRLYGGTGKDAILGDNGLVFTSRNGETEPLYGINSPNLETILSLPSLAFTTTLYLQNSLHKEALILKPELGGNDLIYGGLGDDWLYGGAGDDGILGAEALLDFYNANPITNLNPLNYNLVTRTFAAFDLNNPLQKINNFFLNFTATIASQKIKDGSDRIFGNLGNDWLVGGTENDFIFGDLGDDLLNGDDNLDTNRGLNNIPESSEFIDADLLFGDEGLDRLIGNTEKDRLIDGSNDLNAFFLPFQVTIEPTITQLLSSELIEFLLKLRQR